jgi:hypothetical protein
VSIGASAALVSASAARASDDPQTLVPLVEEGPVLVNDFRLMPMSHVVADEHALELHPKALLGVGYDSNVDATPSNPKDDVYYDAIVGCELRYTIDDNNGVTAGLELGVHNYADSKHYSGGTGRARLNYVWVESPVTTHQLFLTHSRLIDPLTDNGVISNHGYTTGRLESAHHAWGFELGSRLMYSRDIYYTGDLNALPHERDNQTYKGALTLGHFTGSRSQLDARAEIDHIDYLRYGRYQDNTGVTTTAGWRVSFLPRTSLDANVGGQWRWFADDFNHDPAYADRTVISPIINVLLRWEPEDYSYAGIRGFVETQPSSISNEYYVRGLMLVGKMRLLVNSSIQGEAQVRHLEASGAPAGSPRERRDTYRFSTITEYMLREGVAARLLGSYEVSDSLTANDYRRFVAGVELAVAY